MSHQAEVGRDLEDYPVPTPCHGKGYPHQWYKRVLGDKLEGKKKKARETFPWKYGLGKGHPVSGTSSRSLLAESDKFFKQHNIFKSSRAKTQGCRIAQQALVKWMNQGIGRFITESNAMASVQILHVDWLGREEVTIKWGIRKFSPSPHTCSSSPESLQFDTLFLQGPNECNPQSRGAETEL